MNAEGMSANERRPPVVEAEFMAWLGEDGARALVSRSHGRYYAQCIHFGVAGTGTSPDEALQDAAALLSLYLQAAYLSGRTFEESKKPVPRTLRLRLWMRHLRAGVLKHMTLPFTGFGRTGQVPIGRETASFSR